MKIKYNIFTIWLSIIIFFNLQGFYLIDSSVPTSDIAIFLEVFLFLYVMFFKKNRVKSTYFVLFLIPVVLVMTSAFMANLSYDQPIIYGIRAQRQWIVALFMYFPISKLIRNGEISVENVWTMLDKINIVYILLVVTQYLLSNQVTFLHVLAKERYDSTRLYVSLMFVLISYFFHLHKVLVGKRIKFIDWFMIIMPIFLQFFVTKSRMGLAAMLVATLLMIGFNKPNKRKYAFVLLGIFGIVVISELPMGQDIINMISGNKAEVSQDTSKIREIGRTFFLNKISSNSLHTLFGSGFVNIKWPLAVKLSHYDQGIFPADNGIFGILFYYGYSFVIWSIALYGVILKNAWKVRREVFFYLLCGLIGCYSLNPNNYNADISFALVCALTERIGAVQSGEGENKIYEKIF